MHWGRIEAVVYAEEDKPYDFLGAHRSDDGTLIQAYFPEASAVSVLYRGKKYPMECADESGFFAVLLEQKNVKTYRYSVEYESGTVECEDAYRFAATLSEKEMEAYAAGIHYEAYKMLGAHPMVIGGVAGVRFAVWAPNAVRVSVVGDFNVWDGRRLPIH